MNADIQLLEELETIRADAGSHNVGDAIIRAIEIRSRIADPLIHQLADVPMFHLRGLAVRADYGWQLFANPPTLPKVLEDVEVLQLFAIEAALHELGYALENVEVTAVATWGGSTPTRFYLNSIYHYVSSMFLVDTSSPKHKNMPMGGTVIRALHPIGLASLLEPIKRILGQPFGEGATFGDAILGFRHSFLVHGTFSPRNVEYLVAQTKMREPSQQMRFSAMVWDLFHETILLRLRIIAMLTASNISVVAVVQRYLVSVLKTEFRNKAA